MRNDHQAVSGAKVGPKARVEVLIAGSSRFQTTHPSLSLILLLNHPAPAGGQMQQEGKVGESGQLGYRVHFGNYSASSSAS